MHVVDKNLTCDNLISELLEPARERVSLTSKRCMHSIVNISFHSLSLLQGFQYACVDVNADGSLLVLGTKDGQ